MILLLKLIVITSIWVLGIKIATSKDMLLEKLGDYGERKVNEGYKIFEALIVCEFCMPSIHSLIGFGLAYGMGIIVRFTGNQVFYYPLVVMGASILSGFAWNMYLTMNTIKEKNREEADYFERHNYILDSEMDEPSSN